MDKVINKSSHFEEVKKGLFSGNGGGLMKLETTRSIGEQGVPMQIRYK